MTRDPSETQLLVAVFANKKGDKAFFPLQEAASEFRNEALKWGRKHNEAVHSLIGMSYTGGVHALDKGAMYPRVALTIPGQENPLYICPFEGPMYEACMAAPGAQGEESNDEAGDERRGWSEIEGGANGKEDDAEAAC